MKALFTLTFALYLTLIFPAAGAETKLSPLLARLDKTLVIKASFVQTKNLQALKRPLVTHGKLIFLRDRGVLWQIDKPYRASYLLGTDSVTEIATDGSRKVRSTREVPAIAQIGKVFRAIFQGDVQAMENYFDVSRRSIADHWLIDLTPKPQLAQFLKSISARGSNFLERIDIEETSGDQTHIEFHDNQFDAPLTNAEHALFGD